MGIFEIIGGALLIGVCIVVITLITMQESKGGLGVLSGDTGSSFFDRNRGKTREAMLVRATTVTGIALAVLTLLMLFITLR